MNKHNTLLTIFFICGITWNCHAEFPMPNNAPIYIYVDNLQQFKHEIKDSINFALITPELAIYYDSIWNAISNQREKNPLRIADYNQKCYYVYYIFPHSKAGFLMVNSLITDAKNENPDWYYLPISYMINGDLITASEVDRLVKLRRCQIKFVLLSISGDKTCLIADIRTKKLKHVHLTAKPGTSTKIHIPYKIGIFRHLY